MTSECSKKSEKISRKCSKEVTDRESNSQNSRAYSHFIVLELARGSGNFKIYGPSMLITSFLGSAYSFNVDQIIKAAVRVIRITRAKNCQKCS
jgi:hypothetical protein